MQSGIPSKMWFLGKPTALQAKSAKPKDKQDKLTDGEGLHLLVMPNGSKYWRYDYRYQDKRKTLPLGVYPDMSLSDARDLHAEARQKSKTVLTRPTSVKLPS